MNADVIAVLEDCTAGSDAGRLTFPQVLGALAAVGIERYHADLCRAEKTYYRPDGGSHVVPAAPLAVVPASAFSADAVEAAIRAVQAGTIPYKEFCERIAAAGCVGYLVSLAGRRAVYFGRGADSHVEPFPPGR
jgi:uncharacterized protein YbcV (DUF1398 family)